MHQPKPDPGQCACGRPRADAAAAVYHAPLVTYAYFRCACGAEWTERRAALDRSEPISTDEVIEVYQRLEAFDGSISELVETLTA